MNTEQRDTPKRGIDYNVYPPSATSDRKGWAVTIGGEYIEGVRFACRSVAEAYAQTKVLEKRKAMPQIPERNAAGIAYPSIEEQEKFWEQRDIGGNTTPDKIQANLDRYGIGKQPWDSEPVESWDVDFEHE